MEAIFLLADVVDLTPYVISAFETREDAEWARDLYQDGSRHTYRVYEVPFWSHADMSKFTGAE